MPPPPTGDRQAFYEKEACADWSASFLSSQKDRRESSGRSPGSEVQPVVAAADSPSPAVAEWSFESASSLTVAGPRRICTGLPCYALSLAPETDDCSMKLGNRRGVKNSSATSASDPDCRVEDSSDEERTGWTRQRRGCLDRRLQAGSADVTLIATPPMLRMISTMSHIGRL